MDERVFIEAIQANPADEVARLVYADWLDEHGDPRGELIRVQCELTHCTENDEQRKLLDEREAQLFVDYGETWLEPLRQLGALGVSVRYFRRGLLEHLKISAENFLQHAETLCQMEPALSRVQLVKFSPHINEFVATEFPAQITAFDLSANQLISEKCQVLASSRITSRIKELDLKFNRLEAAGLSDLLAVNWPSLERLDLSSNRLGPAGAEVLARQTALPNLKVLLLSMNQLQDAGATALLNSINFPHLEELHLACNHIGIEGLSQKTPTASFPSLKVLNLRYNRIQAHNVQKLESLLSERLQVLDLKGNLYQHY